MHRLHQQLHAQSSYSYPMHVDPKQRMAWPGMCAACILDRTSAMFCVSSSCKITVQLMAPMLNTHPASNSSCVLEVVMVPERLSCVPVLL